MKNYSILRASLILIATLMLFACGGGGSSTSDNGETPAAGVTVIKGRA